MDCGEDGKLSSETTTAARLAHLSKYGHIICGGLVFFSGELENVGKNVWWWWFGVLHMFAFMQMVVENSSVESELVILNGMWRVTTTMTTMLRMGSWLKINEGCGEHRRSLFWMWLIFMVDYKRNDLYLNWCGFASLVELILLTFICWKTRFFYLGSSQNITYKITTPLSGKKRNKIYLWIMLITFRIRFVFYKYSVGSGMSYSDSWWFVSFSFNWFLCHHIY